MKYEWWPLTNSVHIHGNLHNISTCMIYMVSVIHRGNNLIIWLNLFFKIFLFLRDLNLALSHNLKFSFWDLLFIEKQDVQFVDLYYLSTCLWKIKYCVCLPRKDSLSVSWENLKVIKFKSILENKMLKYCKCLLNTPNMCDHMSCHELFLSSSPPPPIFL